MCKSVLQTLPDVGQVTNNASQAEHLSAQADELEETISKEFADKSAQVTTNHFHVIYAHTSQKIRPGSHSPLSLSESLTSPHNRECMCVCTIGSGSDHIRCSATLSLKSVLVVNLSRFRRQVVMFQRGETLDLSREDMGIITVSQSISSLGIIESANAVALTMFGYNKRDMLSQVGGQPSAQYLLVHLL
jgi:hypothetical protein